MQELLGQLEAIFRLIFGNTHIPWMSGVIPNPADNSDPLLNVLRYMAFLPKLPNLFNQVCFLTSFTDTGLLNTTPSHYRSSPKTIHRKTQLRLIQVLA